MLHIYLFIGVALSWWLGHFFVYDYMGKQILEKNATTPVKFVTPKLMILILLFLRYTKLMAIRRTIENKTLNACILDAIRKSTKHIKLTTHQMVEDCSCSCLKRNTEKNNWAFRHRRRAIVNRAKVSAFRLISLTLM